MNKVILTAMILGSLFFTSKSYAESTTLTCRTVKSATKVDLQFAAGTLKVLHLHDTIVTDEGNLVARSYDNGENVNGDMGFPFEEGAWIFVRKYVKNKVETYELVVNGQNDSSPTRHLFGEDLFCNGSVAANDVGSLSLTEISHVEAELTLDITAPSKFSGLKILYTNDHLQRLPAASCDEGKLLVGTGPNPDVPSKTKLQLKEYSGVTYNFRVCLYDLNGQLANNSLVGTIVITGD